MKRTLGLTALLAWGTIGWSADTGFTDAQKKEIQSIVHDYLVNQPEVLIEASTTLQQKQQQRMQAGVQKAVSVHAKEVFQDQLTSVGQSTAPVTLVEFFDYQCIHCKKMSPVLDAVTKQNPQLRVVYKEFPIFGAGSILASKAALAAAMQNKYLPMHQALLEIKAPLSEDLILKTAAKLHLNVAKLKQDMNSQTVKDKLDANRKLAEALQLMGTPAIIIAPTPKGVYQAGEVTFIPGSTSEAALVEVVKKANKS